MAYYDVKPIGSPDMTKVRVKFHFWDNQLCSSYHQATPGFNGLADRIIEEAEKALLNKQNTFRLFDKMYGVYPVPRDTI